jgi:antitoxin component of MazEF toxin-antitoxin module
MAGRSFVSKIVKVGREFRVIFPDDVVEELELREGHNVKLSIGVVDGKSSDVEFVK